MPINTIFDNTNKGTLRPNKTPIDSSSKPFTPIELPAYDFTIRLPKDVSPDNPISLFSMYYTPKIIE